MSDWCNIDTVICSCVVWNVYSSVFLVDDDDNENYVWLYKTNVRHAEQFNLVD